ECRQEANQPVEQQEPKVNQLGLPVEKQKQQTEEEGPALLNVKRREIGDRAGWVHAQSPLTVWRRAARALPVFSSTSTITECSSAPQRAASMRTGSLERDRCRV